MHLLCNSRLIREVSGLLGMGLLAAHKRLCRGLEEVTLEMISATGVSSKIELTELILVFTPNYSQEGKPVDK